MDLDTANNGERAALGIAALEEEANAIGRERAKRWLAAKLEEKIRAYDWPSLLPDPEGGEPYQLKQWPERQINTAVGVIHVKVPMYWKKGYPTLLPHINIFGMRGTIAPLLLHRAVSAAADLPFAKAAAELKELTGAEVTGETIRVLAQEVGAIALGAQLKPELPEGFASPRRITTYLDGGRAPTTKGWKEPRLARIELQADDGRTHTLVLTRLCSAQRFWEVLEPLLDRLGAKGCSMLAFVGDGAPWILNEAKKRYPHALTILDLYHVSETLHKTAKRIYGESSERGRQWAHGTARQLKRGRVTHVLEQLQQWHDQAHGKTKQALAKLLGYLKPRAASMRYRTFRRRGFPLGSGRIEAMIKQVSNLRLKRTGARWNHEHAEAMLGLRAAKLYGTLDQAWRAYVTPITSLIPPALRPYLNPANPATSENHAA